MEIQEVKISSPQIKKFEEDEWVISDIEHYGKEVDLRVKKYKFVARDNNESILGILELVIRANVAFLEGLLVSHKHRGEGIGSKLLTFAENFAKKNKCTKIWTETDEDWVAAKFYKKKGYEICGIHEKHFFGRKAVILSKFF